jgi:GT2 family glycosyltransferase
MLRVSVIIPSYNRADYLPLTLQSIFDQALIPDEIIVVDDGSTDGTTELVRTYGTRVRYFCQDHLGVAAARNLGLSMAQGDVIAWLDADDLWDPDFLLTLVSRLELDQGIDGVYAGFALIDSAGNVLVTPELKVVPPGELFRALIDSDFIITSAFVVRRKCFEQVGHFDESFRICEDYDMFLRLSKVFTLVGVCQPLMKLRVHEHNITRDTQIFCQFRLALTAKHFGPGEGNPAAWPEDKRRAHAHAFLACAVRYFQDQKPETGWQYVRQAVLTWPSLLDSLDLYFELAFGGQPRVCRGRVDLLDIESQGAELLLHLGAIFAEAGPEVQAHRQAAYGNAYLTLGILNDQAGPWAEARSYLWRAIAADPRLLISYPVVRRLVKLSAGQRLVSVLRSMRPG